MERRASDGAAARRRPDALRVRQARPSDREALAGLRRELERLHQRLQPGFFTAGGGAGDGAEAGGSERNRVLLVAEQEAAAGAVLGFVEARLYDTPSDPSLARRLRLHVEALVVAPQARRRGVGGWLMEAAREWGLARGAEQVVLTVWEGNAAAEGFYRALGFARVSQLLARELS